MRRRERLLFVARRRRSGHVLIGVMAAALGALYLARYFWPH
jgi:hypothetical protein